MQIRNHQRALALQPQAPEGRMPTSASLTAMTAEPHDRC
ncbi:hypothetical protein MBEBAB_2321 [Brevundimonas abyssalis TAR-001]|uniref:Uncharacterized protein n=1 Tax=Brevundimonas abyssalis TAR-001 TaxID=1391729 RepID=A0A8E0TT91_9CAUL|nr:hypothetical protein MBEBAB_2321 [Brevundimonas abyssalis TAR-001]